MTMFQVSDLTWNASPVRLREKIISFALCDYIYLDLTHLQ